MTNKIIKGLYRVKKIGDSLHITIDKEKRNLLEVHEGDFVVASICKVNEKKIKCSKCGYDFIVLENDDVYDCPGCGAELLDIDTKPVNDEGLIEGEEIKTGSLKGGISE
jgi:Zn finger protein HypA/HybF involved in hydrogenase expression